MFQPPRCPYGDCPAHEIERYRERHPHRSFYLRHGGYRPKCRPWRVPRFRCRECRRTFSRQTFRQDYRDHKPHLNARLLRLLANGQGLRRSAVLLGLSRRCCVLKARKLSRAREGLDRNAVG